MQGQVPNRELMGLAVLLGWSAAVLAGQTGSGEPACEAGRTLADIEPQEAIIERFPGRAARIFVDAIRYPGEPVDAEAFDQVLVLSGPGVMGGIVAVLAHGECPVARKFLSALDYLHGIAMIGLFEDHPELRRLDRLDETKVRELAEGGIAAAQFHEGFVHGLGRGVPEDRGAAIDWFKRSAATGHAPAMLALGMALTGPGVLKDEARMPGKPPRQDALTDLPQACYWLSRAAGLRESPVSGMAEFTFSTDLSPTLSPEHRRRCKELLRAP